MKDKPKIFDQLFKNQHEKAVTVFRRRRNRIVVLSTILSIFVGISVLWGVLSVGTSTSITEGSAGQAVTIESMRKIDVFFLLGIVFVLFNLITVMIVSKYKQDVYEETHLTSIKHYDNVLFGKVNERNVSARDQGAKRVLVLTYEDYKEVDK